MLAPGWELKVEDPLLREDIAAAAHGDPRHRLSDASQLASRLAGLPMRRQAQQQRAAAEAQAARDRLSLERARARRSEVPTACWVDSVKRWASRASAV